MKPAKCHPDRPHVAKGMCKICYNREHNRKRNPTRKQALKGYFRTWKGTLSGRRAMLLSLAKSNARVKGLSFDISLEDVVIPELCPVLNIPLDSAAKRPAWDLPSLDRIDNSKGYVKGNVWVISWRANAIKRDASLLELQALVKALESRTQESA